MKQLFLSPAQCRMARALLNWTQPELAELCNLAPMTISKFEKEHNDYRPEARTIEKIMAVFENAGLEFTSGEGVKRKENTVIILKGHDGFSEFRNMVLSQAQIGPMDICVSNVDEAHFSYWGGKEMNEHYREEMSKLDTVKCRIMVKEGDKNLVASGFAEYRWVPEKDFGDIPFYIFGDATAIIPFEENNLNIFIVKNSLITRYFRKQFNLNWEKAKSLGK